MEKLLQEKDNGHIWLADTTENDRENMKMNKQCASFNSISEDVALWIKSSLLKGTVKNVYHVASVFSPGSSLPKGYIHSYSVCFINSAWFVLLFFVILA